MSGKPVLVGLDTSVVLRLLMGEPADQFQAAIAFLDQLVAQGKQAAVNDLVISKTYFTLQFHYNVPKRRPWPHVAKAHFLHGSPWGQTELSEGWGDVISPTF